MWSKLHWLWIPHHWNTLELKDMEEKGSIYFCVWITWLSITEGTDLLFFRGIWRFTYKKVTLNWIACDLPRTSLPEETACSVGTEDAPQPSVRLDVGAKRGGGMVEQPRTDAKIIFFCLSWKQMSFINRMFWLWLPFAKGRVPWQFKQTDFCFFCIWLSFSFPVPAGMIKRLGVGEFPYWEGNTYV